MTEDEAQYDVVVHDVGGLLGTLVVPDGMSLRVPGDLTYNQADALMGYMWQRRDQMAWYIGDLLNATKDTEYYSQLLNESKFEVKTCQNYMRVAANVRANGRWENLRHGHHEAACALAPDEQDEWLKYASEGAWSVRRLRDELRDAGLIKAKEKTTKPTAIKCPHCDRWTFEGVPCMGCEVDVLNTAKAELIGLIVALEAKEISGPEALYQARSLSGG